jgi:hypothetical protein
MFGATLSLPTSKMVSCYSKLSQKRDPRESNSMHRSDISENPAAFPMDAA